MSAIAQIDPDHIHIERLFTTPVARLAHPEAEALNAALSAAILARAAEGAGVQHSNERGWQSPDDFEQWSGEAGAQLVAFARAFANELTAVHDAQAGLVAADLQWRYNAWANVNRAGDANALHGHPGCFWSGVYWVDDGGCGEDPALGGQLEFVDPRGLMPSAYNPQLRMRIQGCLTAGYCSHVAPRSGTLLMFPSWLLHRVVPHTSARARISVAFNFGV
ncbi:TIGR02466 family protein [Pseudomonas sp. NPDC007930]|uniref:TIGR02466 family protein n=1 Tax=Pseudomonas sp. NPDC007930 TaxID=3364417 RepID=UPI0036E43CA4